MAFAVTTAEMMTASAFVIGKRVARMQAAGLVPNARDQREFTLMGQEKLEAAALSWQAMAQGLFTAGPQLALQSGRQMTAAAAALSAVATSRTPQQAFKRQVQAANALGEVVGAGSRLADVAASVAQAGLDPIHAKATANAKRLGR